MTIRLRASAAATLTTTGDWQDRPTYGVLRIGTHVFAVAAISPALTEDPDNGDVLRIVDEGAPFDLTLTSAGEAALNAIIAAGLDEVTATISLHSTNPGPITNISNSTELTSARNPGYQRLTIAFESLVQ